MSSISYAFFGTGPLAESVLAALVRSGFTPTLLVTKPDAMQGRHMQLTAPHIKTWAEMKNIPVYQPESLREMDTNSPLYTQHFDVFIVASYGKIIPEEILSIPTQGVLNVHPSLLPLYRGPSPIESALLDGTMTTGVSIMKLDAEMDHGPLLAQTAFIINPETTAGQMEVECGQAGGDLLAQSLPHYLDGALLLKEQDHSRATFCKKITKELGEVTLNDRASEIQKKFRALTPWPSVYFFIDHKDRKMRVKINKANLTLTGTDSLIATDVIERVTPEGKGEMTFEDFRRGYLKDN
jgi:methionyl-tRNA formyltransferase